MADYYMIMRARITTDYLTASHARELYDEARTRPHADLRGDFDSGFYYWAFTDESGLRLIRCRVTPVPADEVPDPVRQRLDST